MQAYAAANTSGPTTIFLRQKDGLLNAKDGLAVPRSFLTATGRNEDLEEVDEVSFSCVSMHSCRQH